MATSLEKLQRKLATLQQQVDTAKAREAVGVIERIKTAIEFYGLTASDLFGSKGHPGRPSTQEGGRARIGRPPKSDGVKGKVGRPAKAAGAKRAAGKKAPLPPKYRDEAGNTWSGQGKRPNWFKAALEGGKTADQLLVKSEDQSAERAG
jgi:DNA-binding protein H-NS